MTEVGKPAHSIVFFNPAVLTSLFLFVLAALLSAGNLSSDDHFFVVDIAGKWLHGQPALIHDIHPPSRSLLWPGMIYAGLRLAQLLGVADPSRQMVVVRLLQAIAGVLVVGLVGRHAAGLGRPRGARLAQWMVAGFYFMPFLFVRQLFEIGCLPFLMAAIYLLDPDVPRGGADGRLRAGRAAFLGGALLAFALIIRPQLTLFFIGGCAVLLWRRRWATLGLLLVGLALVLAVEGWVDFHVWGEWFAPQLAYYRRNLLGYGLVGQDYYVSGPWWKYLGFLAVLLIPPFSILVFYGVVRAARCAPFVAAGVLVFFLGHCQFPGKQERFIVPMLPHFLMLAGIGLAPEGEVARLRGWRWIWGLGIAVNLILLPFWIGNYTQRARIESVRAAAARPDARAFLVLQTEHSTAEVPDFYLHPARPYLSVDDTLNLAGQRAQALSPNYAVMYGNRNREGWLRGLSAAGYHPELVETFEPSVVDGFFHWINPYRNHSRSATLYHL